MIKKIILLLIIVLGFESQAQVGINTTTPKAQLEIKSTNEATPANTDGLIIPKINAFPVTNPTVDQQGMLVYLTTTVGANSPGFYYWNNPTTAWLPVKGTDGGTLDQAYDFGGAGNGRTITADAGAVTINGTDGLVVSGSIALGALAPSGTGTRMVWNPRKAAFRAGTVTGTLWDDSNIGNGSVAFTMSTASGNSSFAGSGATASGQSSVAFGQGTTASGVDSVAAGFFSSASSSRAVAFGSVNTASGSSSTAFGANSTASGSTATAFGNVNNASGSVSTAFGMNNTASSFGETVIGIGATTYTPTTNGATQFRTGNETDRLFVIGNAIDANNNNVVDLAERSNAMEVLKNGKTSFFGTYSQESIVEIVGLNREISNDIKQGNLHIRTNDVQGANVGGSITIGGAYGGISPSILYKNFASIEARKANADLLDEDAYLIFKTSASAGLYERMRITAEGNVGIGTTTPLDRLHLVGNIRMVDGNEAEGKVLVSDADGKATWTATDTFASGDLDQAYDFGGNGLGGTITADAGAVTINGTDGLVSTGILGDGAIAPNGDGVKMVWNPRKAAFRAGLVNNGFAWNDANIGDASFAFGISSIASGENSTAFGNSSIASGFISTAFGDSTNANGNQSTAFGRSSFADGNQSTAFGQSTTASGENSTAFGQSTTASGFNSTAFGASSTSSGDQSTAFGRLTAASGNLSTAFGQSNTASSYAETTIGIGATTYTPSINGESQFNSTNVTDRLFVIGNAIDSNNNFVVDLAERRDAMVVLKNGNTGIGVSAPGERLQVAGRALFTNGFSSDNAALIYRNDTDYMFLGPQSGSSANGGALALFGSTNVSGGNAGGIDLNVPNAQVRMSHTNGSYTFRANSTSGYAATFELNDTGLEIGHNSTGRALIFSPNSAERMRITPTGNVGIGTTPARKFHVSNGTSGGTSNANAGFVLESSTIVYQHFLTPSANESGLLFGSNLASINGGIIFNNSLATNGIQFRAGGNANRMTITSAGDVGVGITAPGGQLELSLDEGRKPGTGTWTLSSDRRLKTINGNYTKGLNEILQLNPILFNYKNNGEHKFEQKVLDTEFPGFIAQEVQPLFPDAIGTDADGFLNFNIHPILIASINAFKELNLKNQSIENKNRELELKLKSQEQIINNLIERLEKLEAKN